MRKFVLNALIFTASSTSVVASASGTANDSFDFAQRGVFIELHAENVETSNADHVTVTISGTVRNGLSSCEAAFNRAAIRARKDQGHFIFEATLTPNGALALTCDGSFDPNWQGSEVSKTFRMSQSIYRNARVADYPVRGESIGLEDLVRNSESK